MGCRSAGPSAAAAEVDDSGIVRFWVVADALLQDREPPSSDWDALFATPGYAALEAREHRRSILTRAFHLAYMPSLASERQAAIVKGGWLAFVLPHLSSVPARRAELDSFRHRLESPGLLARAARRAQGVLPPGTTFRRPPPTVCLVFFAPDGRGYPDRIVADLLDLESNPDPEAFFAHELFHFYRRLVQRVPVDAPDALAPFAQALLNMEEEGIADQLDKSDIPRLTEAALARRYPEPKRRDFYEKYRQHFAQANEWLERLDRTLVELPSDPVAAKKEAADFLAALPVGGRPVGAFMARTILERLGRDALQECAGNTAGFVERYQEAARRSGGAAYVLSEKAAHMIRASILPAAE
jgi:hypothetical protein